MSNVDAILDQLTRIESEWIDTRRKKRVRLGEEFIDLLLFALENGDDEQVNYLHLYIQDGLFSGLKDFMAERIPLKLDRIELNGKVNCRTMLLCLIYSTSTTKKEALILNGLLPIEVYRIKNGSVLTMKKFMSVVSKHYTMSIEKA